MPKTQAILFDLDGTLTDSAQGIVDSLLYVMAYMGLRPPPREKLMSYVGPPLWDSLAEIFGPDRAKESLDIFDDYFTGRKMGLRGTTLYQGVPEMLDALAGQGAALYIATSKPTEPTRMLVAHLGLGPLFKLIRTPAADGTGADKPGMIAALMQEEGLSPDATVMVGDRAQDVAGAKANGIPCIGALWGYGSQAELEDAGATALAMTPAHLLDLLALPPRSF